jgi:thiol-disulfide isomerase/thioredoxin
MRFLAAIVALTCLASASLLAADLPRYSLPVGRQLSYTDTSNFQYQSGSFNSVTTLQLTVVARNADGSARIVLRSAERRVQNRQGQPAKAPADVAENVQYSRCEILPDGKVVAANGSAESDAPAVLPPFPVDDGQMAGTWKRQPKLPGNTEIFSSSGPAQNGQWTFSSTQDGLFKRIYGIVNDTTFHFDTGRGIVTEMDIKARQDYAFHGSGTETIRLDSDQMLPADAVGPLGKDVALLLAAQDQEQDSEERLATTSADPHSVAAQIKAALKSAESRVTVPEITRQFDQMLASVDQDVQYTMDDERRIANSKNTAAYDFTATDLDGKPHKLSDYRGKVVVLDFWYRGCGWCIRSMPQMKQVANDFRDKPVAIIGLNTDSKVADAKFVVDAMQLNYPVLRIDHDSVQKYHVQGFPTVLVIDGGGMIRDFDEGYSLTLRKDLTAKIQAVLDADAGPPSAQAR